MINGLLNVGGVSQLRKRDAEKEEGYRQQERNLLGIMEAAEGSRLSSHIWNAWARNRIAKVEISDRLLNCLRARKGEYSEGQLQAIRDQGGADPVYLKLTGTKSRAASAWIRDIVLPSGDRPWSLEPTADPELPDTTQQAIREAAMEEAVPLLQEGLLQNSKDLLDFIAKTRDNVKQDIRETAKEAANRMAAKIEDMMQQGDWETALEDFIEDFVTYPAAFFKGPYVKQKWTLKWGPDYTPVRTLETCLAWRRVSPFDMYPGVNCRTVQEGDLIEHLRYNPKQLYDLIGLDNYKEEEIRAVLEEGPQGLKGWMWQDWERMRLETDSAFLTMTQDGLFDALHYWGSVKGSDLKEWGMNKEIEDEKYYEVDAILIGRHVIRAALNEDPLRERPYGSACWDKIPGSLWGVALPEQMEDHQKIVNACARALCSNMSLASGPQTVVLTDMVAEGEDITNIFPFKVWQAKSSLTGNSGDPVKFYQPDDRATGLINVLNHFETKADDVTNVPRYSYGNEKVGGAGNTATGLSMLMNSAAKGIRRAISNIDASVIRPSVYRTFVWLMMHDDDETIKGDCKVVPRGAAAILIKDQLQVRLQTLLQQTANPIDAQIMGPKGRLVLLRELFGLFDLPVDEILPTEDQVKTMEAAAQQQQQQEQMAADSQAGMTPGLGNEQQMMQNQLQGPVSSVG